MKILLLLLAIFSVSCGKFKSAPAHADKVPVQLKSRTIQALSLEGHSTQADTFTFFFFPKFGQMNWESSVFNSTDTEEEKLSKVVEKVLHLSREIDDGDEQTYLLTLENKKIQKQMEENNCGDDSDGDLGEDTDIDDGMEFKTATGPLCEELTTKLYENMAKADQLSSVIKSELLRELQMSIDAVKFAETDGQVIRSGEFVNWQEYGDANGYTFDLNNLQKPFMYMPTLGKFTNSYSSSDGDIYDIALNPSEYDPTTQMLTFKMKEKGMDGVLTGNILEAELEKVNFAGKIRFTGDIHKVSPSGDIIQHGIMKFELAENEVIDTGDDW